jgi:hypothetical protein
VDRGEQPAKVDMRDQFYITLPSNSSMKYFYNNTTTRYSTQLPRQIELIGEWEVALVEIQYPLTLQTVNEPFNVVRLHTHHTAKPRENWEDVGSDRSEKKKRLTEAEYTVQPGVYTDIWQIIGALNAVGVLNEHLEFGRADSVDDRLVVTRKCTCAAGHYLSFSPGLYRQLGFPKMTTNVATKLMARHPVNLAGGVPAQMFIYSDLVEPRIVGDVCAPLLRIVQTVGKNFRSGSSESKSLSPPHYVPLLLTSFRTIEIDIRDPLGRPMPFTHGTLTVTLHFKRIH